ncbi:hypothetical protein CI105_08330 [Candidatus Izimaplasma bacterium ZiA1]|uniref:class I SAM-dependent methyltransferase n=1 Tax=Candidatus Izimoplasma sp. ZiA1 TaxID=2024899 RepID=UPI000BAA7E51|nr:hypothetical protein CI105_08330 [Candidatus Izimaplasma bacterium ZiA1]
MGNRLGSNFMFNLIAPVYGLFYKNQKRVYSRDLILLSKLLDITSYNNILDVGCGTGALSSVLNNMGVSVTGVEPAKRMLNVASSKKENANITFISVNKEKPLPFDDKSFDLSIASYVAHGMKLDERKKLYLEMSRVSKDFVILYDYNDKRAFVTSIVERLERGDYFNFIKNVKKELNQYFKSFEEIKLSNQASWYICVPLVTKTK